MSQQQRQRRLETRQHEDDGDDVDMMPAASTTATDRVRSELARGGGHRHPAPRSCPPDGARARNRRYRRLQQLGEGGVWFSDEAMKERDPWLWYEYVGKREGEEKPAPKGAVEQVCFWCLSLGDGWKNCWVRDSVVVGACGEFWGVWEARVCVCVCGWVLTRVVVHPCGKQAVCFEYLFRGIIVC